MTLQEIISAEEYNSLSLNYIEKLEEYFKSIEILSQQHLNLEFNNRDKNHARVVMTYLFMEAKEEINIFARDFNGEICNSESYNNQLKNAVKDRNVKLNVVFEQTPKQSEGFRTIKELKSEFYDNIKIYKLNAEFECENRNKLKNFTFVDNNKYRFETNPEAYSAFCNFDDEENVAKLKYNFHKLIENSEKLSL